MTTSSSLSVTRLSSQARIGGGSGSSSQRARISLGRRLAEHEAFEQAVGGEAIGAVKARLGHLARRIKSRRVGPAMDVHQHSAAGIMLRGNNRDRLAGSCLCPSASSFS